MRLDDERRSTNVEDRRGIGGPLIAGGGIGGVILVVLYLLLGGNPNDIPQTQSQPATQQASGPQNDKAKDFVAAVLGDTEDVWHEQLPAQTGTQYVYPKLVLFTQYVQSACGMAQSATGPFYCPLDQKVYIDLSFYDQLKNRFGAPGDFAQAYVIAHEVGHHVQNLLGVSDKVHRAEESAGSRTEANKYSVALELQADCYAGVWGHFAQKTKNILEPGDLEEALNAASAIGDDRLQMETKGYVAPDSFTHGSSKERVGWFRRGFDSGDMKQCDTFAGL